MKLREEQEILGNYGVHNVTVPEDMLGLLRSDHAGETGAVWIYKGANLAFWSQSTH